MKCNFPTLPEISFYLTCLKSRQSAGAEHEYFDVCSFTQTDLLKEEIATSEISGKRYRLDQQTRSAVSGKTGHKQELVICHETRQPIALDEAERCEITGTPSGLVCWNDARSAARKFCRLDSIAVPSRANAP